METPQIAPNQPEPNVEGRDLALTVADLLTETPASNTVVMDIGGISSFADYFVICSGDNERQVRAIASAVRERLNEQGRLPRRMEGEAVAGWIVLDYGDVIVHVFDAGQRSFYQLESLWDRAPTILSIQ